MNEKNKLHKLAGFSCIIKSIKTDKQKKEKGEQSGCDVYDEQ
jgi:hypothetical protein